MPTQLNARAGATSGLADYSAGLKTLVRPTFDAALMDGAVNPLITFTRASAKTYFDQNGVMQTASTDQWPVEYDPSTGVCLGRSVWEARTNLLSGAVLGSNAWSDDSGSGGITFTQTQTGLTNSTNEAWLITDNANNVPHYTLTAAAAGTLTAAHSVSAFVKAGTMTKVQLFVSSALSNAYATFDLATGTLINSGGTSLVAASEGIQRLANGWFRLSFSATMSASAGGVGVCGNPSGQNLRLPAYVGTGSTWIVQGAQIELGSFPTPYIPTTTATVTRAADVPSVTGTNFSSWFNASEGTFVVETNTVAPIASRNAFMLQVLGAVGMNHFFNFGKIRITDGTSQADVTSISDALAAAAIKSSSSYVAGSNMNIAARGSSVSSVAACLLSLPTSMNIGTSLNGYITRITYYPKRLPDTILRGLTS